MKRKQPSRKDLLASCDSVGPEDGLDPKRYFRAAPSKVANRKALQLCGEVAKTLSFALGWEMGDDLLSRLCVVSVVPCPDSSRMLVTLTPNGELDGETGDVILDRLRQVVGKLPVRDG